MKKEGCKRMKVYVLVIKKEQDDNEAYIYGVYSTKGRAVEEAHNLPPCFVHISEFYLDDGDDITDETWIREFEPDDIEVYREAFPSNESIMINVKWTYEGQKCSRGFTFYNVPSDENDEMKYIFAQKVTDKLAHMLGEYLNDTYGVNLLVGQPARDKIKMKIMEMI